MAVEAVFIFDRAACVGPEIANRPETVLPGLGAIAGRLAPAGACFCGLCAAELFCSPAPRGLVTSGAVSCSWLGLAVRFSVAGLAVEVRQSRSAARSDVGKAYGRVAGRFPLITMRTAGVQTVWSGRGLVSIVWSLRCFVVLACRAGAAGQRSLAPLRWRSRLPRSWLPGAPACDGFPKSTARRQESVGVAVMRVGVLRRDLQSPR